MQFVRHRGVKLINCDDFFEGFKKTIDFFCRMVYNILNTYRIGKNISTYQRSVKMKISKIVELLGAEVVCGEDRLEEEVHNACGCDMMSDVLAYVKDQAVLLTGLCNLQVVRTAVMMDMKCIVFVRNKKPTDDIIELARESDIVVLTSPKRMYTACGALYVNGLQGGSIAHQ